MKYVYLTLNWLFGVLFGLAGLITLIESPLGGFCLVAISLLLLPPVKNIVYEKTKKELPFKARAVSIFVLVIAFGIFAGQSQEKRAAELAAQKVEEKAQKAAEARQDKIDYFNSHREEIISSASSAISEKNYKLALNQTEKYLPAKNAELNEIYNQAKKSLDKIERAEREAKEKLQREAKTKELVAKLKTVPAYKFKKNKDLYQQLVKLNPLEAEYKQKFDHYSRKLTEKLDKEKKRKKSVKKKEKLVLQNLVKHQLKVLGMVRIMLLSAIFRKLQMIQTA